MNLNDGNKKAQNNDDQGNIDGKTSRYLSENIDSTEIGNIEINESDEEVNGLRFGKNNTVTFDEKIECID